MADQPWHGDACTLIDEFRAGRRSPTEEITAAVEAIAASDLNAVSHLDAEGALAAAREADVSRPFGGLPLGIKQLEPLAGWPHSEGSLVFADRVAGHTSTMLDRVLRDGGAIPVAQTTASEFGGLNISVNRLNGVTHNPWRHGRTCGGSSGGSAAVVVGGLLPLATAGDGGGSIRIPAGYTGLFGMKGTYGRIPRGPNTRIGSNTIVLGCVSRSVRDTARYWDVCAGYHLADPTSLPSSGRWEAELGTRDLRGRTVLVAPSLGGVPLAPGVEARIEAAADALIRDLGLRRIEWPLDLPRLAAQWMMGNVAYLMSELGERWPKCAPLLTDEVRAGVYASQSLYNLRVAAAAQQERTRANAAMAAAFEQADFIIGATNPDPAFAADAPMSSAGSRIVEWARGSRVTQLAMPAAMAAARVGSGVWPSLPSALLDWASSQFEDLMHMGALTMVSNMYGNPAASIPIEHLDGLPIGLQVLAAHHRDAELLDLALHVERERPWPLVATRGDAAPDP
jgi:Asp-tRNA(Asn)/Glu-tRNA(Gln) amidotransferase A subunit family amidase